MITRREKAEEKNWSKILISINKINKEGREREKIEKENVCVYRGHACILHALDWFNPWHCIRYPSITRNNSPQPDEYH